MTSRVIQEGDQKTYMVVFEAGEEVTAGLLAFANEQHLSAAHLTAIGAFERVTLAFFDLQTKEYRKIPVNEQVELLSLTGNIALDEENKPKLHAHVVIGKADGTAHGGHLLEAYARPTVEAVVVASSGSLRRRMRPEFGLALLDLSD